MEATADAPPIGVVAENRRSGMAKLVTKSSATAPAPYGINPSMSVGFRPASAIALSAASSARDTGVRSVPRRYFVSPTPVTAPASRNDMGTILSGKPLEVCAQTSDQAALRRNGIWI